MSSAFTPAADDGSVLLVQLTDSHLLAETDGTLLGLDTCASLQQVIGLVRAEQANIDMLLATGDLSQDGSETSYIRFRQMTDALAPHARWLPGNHDEWANMRAACVGTDLLEPVVDVGNWRVTLLDSLIPGAVPGYLENEQLALLERSLSEAPDRHHLVCLHHHPVDIGSEWMAPIGLLNPDALFAVLDRFPQVRAVLWGHVHQEVDRLRGEVRLLASPSTCVQFTPGSDEFDVDVTAPGYRWLRLHADGRLETDVSRLAGFIFQPDYDDGY